MFEEPSQNFEKVEEITKPKPKHSFFQTRQEIPPSDDHDDISFGFEKIDQNPAKFEDEQVTEIHPYLKKTKFMMASKEKEKMVTVPPLKTPKKELNSTAPPVINPKISRINLKKNIIPISILENKAWKAALQYFEMDVNSFFKSVSSNDRSKLEEPLRSYNLSKIHDFDGFKVPNLIAIVKNFELHRDTITLVLMVYY